MKLIAASVLSLGLIGGGSQRAWSQHEGHGGMTMPEAAPESKEDAARKKQERLAKLQEKIDAIDEQLQDEKLPAKKRAKLEAKLKKLLKEKDHLLGTGKAAPKPRGQQQAAVYVCPMGDYRGAMTPNGRCPKCGMNLQKQ